MGHWWNEHPWRMIQTNLREIDMKDIEASVYVEKLQKMKATVAMINTGGILASYDTEVKDHTKSEFLKGDTLYSIMEACHKANIKVIARMDFSKARRSVYEQHPDWAYRDIDGNIVDYNGDVHMCICGGFQQEKALEILKEVAQKLPIDGVFINMGGFLTRDYSYNNHGICHCGNCRKRFMEAFGLELPEKEDMNNETYRKYCNFKKQIISELKKKTNDLIKEINPEIAVEGVDFFRIESNTEYKREGPLWQYNASSVARAVRSLNPERVCSNSTVDFVGFFYRHISVGSHLHALRMWQNIANFGSLDYYLIGRLDNHRDRSAYSSVKKAFSYMAEHEKFYHNMCINGDVLVIREGKHMPSDEGKGWIRALTESHILLEEAEPDRLWPDTDLSRFKIVIIADIKGFSREASQKIDEYVSQGGCLIVTGQTGIYDENGKERNNVPFECIGAELVKFCRHDMASAMFEIKAEEKEFFPSLDDTDLIYFGDDYVFADYKNQVKRYMNLIPPHSYGPPERCYFEHVTQLPAFTVSAYGKGKAIHIPWLPGKIYHRDGYLNTYYFMKDLLKHIAGAESTEQEAFSPMVEVTRGCEKDGSRIMIHLVNNSGHFGVSYFEPIPVQNIRLKIKMERKPKEIFELTKEKEPEWFWEDGYLQLFINQLEEFEAIDIQF